jgi:predicted metal-dependent hydrolase
VTHKSSKIAALIADLQGRDLDAHYLGWFACFNRGQFYEAHDVLEELWLADRHGPNGNFYKGLIQFAGAFVHLQKDCAKYPRLRPAAALFTLAEENFRPYPATHQRLDLDAVRALITDWRGRLQSGDFTRNPLTPGNAPKLTLEVTQTR